MYFLRGSVYFFLKGYSNLRDTIKGQFLNAAFLVGRIDA